MFNGLLTFYSKISIFQELNLELGQRRSAESVFKSLKYVLTMLFKNT